MADVYISYDEKTAENIVRQISEALEKDGISCWYAGRDMEKDELRGVITEAIENCRAFLLILNKSALQSAYVQSEIALAVQGFGDEKDRKLIAFRTDECDVSANPRILSHFQIINGFPLDSDKIFHLLRQMSRILSPETSVLIINPMTSSYHGWGGGGGGFQLRVISNNFGDNASINIIHDEISSSSKDDEILRELNAIECQLSETEPIIAHAIAYLCKAIKAHNKREVEELLKQLSCGYGRDTMVEVGSPALLSWMGLT